MFTCTIYVSQLKRTIYVSRLKHHCIHGDCLPLTAAELRQRSRGVSATPGVPSVMSSISTAGECEEMCAHTAKLSAVPAGARFAMSL